MPSLRYVILRHDGVAEPHFDLMVETYAGSQLSTWRLPVWPIEAYGIAIRLRDHRRMYLDYEGEVPGHRGSVHQLAAGECEVDVGEGSVWSVRLLTGVSPLTLTLKQIDQERWEVRD